VHKDFWWGNLRARDHLEGTYLEARLIFKRIFKNIDGETCIGLIWLRIGTSGVLL
jgi:hypothetical protein